MSSFNFGGAPDSSGGSDPFGTPGVGATGPAFAGNSSFTDPQPDTNGGPGIVGAPFLWLGAALLTAVGALVGALLVSSLWPAVVTWLLAGPVGIGLLAVYIHQDNQRRSMPFYAASQAADWGRRLQVVLSLAAVALSAWTIADIVARGGL